MHIARIYFLSALLSMTAIYSSNIMASEPAIVIIGASYADASVPYTDDLIAPLGGIAVNFGSYLSLGNGLVKDPRLPGYVINEAQGGATTFDRPGCNPGPDCTFGEWQGYEKQFQKAMGRVTIPGAPTPNARYAVITFANDCLHSDAFGIPQDQAAPCDYAQLNEYIDRLIAIGQQALNLGITPIFDLYPTYTSLNLPLAQSLFGLYWIADEAYYNQMRDLHSTRLQTELPGAVVLDIWAEFEHIGEGLHPNDKTVRKAAAIIAQYIEANP